MIDRCKLSSGEVDRIQRAVDQCAPDGHPTRAYITHGDWAYRILVTKTLDHEALLEKRLGNH